MFLCRYLSKQNIFQTRNYIRPSVSSKPQHLICFKDWTCDMVMEIIISAMNLKSSFRDTHNRRLDILSGSKVMIMQEINEPILNLAVSKAATFLGACDINITDRLVWEHDYFGKVFSYMADVIFVATKSHMCVQRFAEQSSVPVMCMRSRTHASIQALATIMAVFEFYGAMKCMNLAWLGPPHPALNSYLLLCPMLGANIRFKCCCDVSPVSPLVLKISEEMTMNSYTEAKECKLKEDLLYNACVVIAGPSTQKKENLPHFTLSLKDIQTATNCDWIFFHTCPRGPEVDDSLFKHSNAKTFDAFENMQFIAAALMAKSIKNYTF